MPAKRRFKKSRRSLLNRLRGKHDSPLHKLLVLIAIVVIWWGVWTILDILFLEDKPMLSAVIAIIVAFFFLFLDDFHLRELE